MIYVSDAWIVAAGVVLAVGVGRHWAWGPFVLGPIISAVGLGANIALMWLAIRVVRPSQAEMQRAKPRQRQWYVITIPNYLSFELLRKTEAIRAKSG